MSKGRFQGNKAAIIKPNEIEGKHKAELTLHITLARHRENIENGISKGKRNSLKSWESR